MFQPELLTTFKDWLVDYHVRGKWCLSLVALMAIGVSGCNFLNIASDIGVGGSTKKAPVLEKSGVLVQDLSLQRSVHVRHQQLGTVTDLQWGNFLPDEGEELAAVSDTGVVFFDRGGEVRKVTNLYGMGDDVDLIAFGPNKETNFIRRGSWASSPELIGLDGVVIWTLGSGGDGVDDMCAGDVDGDGITDFAVGFNGSGGIRLYDEKGKQRWRKADGNVWHVEIVDYDGRGAMGIAHSNAGGELTLRDAQGTVLSQATPAAYFSGFSQCRWPGEGSKAHLLSTGEDAHWVLDCKGAVVAKLPAHGSGDLSTSLGTAVQFVKDDPPHFAVLTDYGSSQNAAVLWVYDSKGGLAYQEVLQVRGAAILALRDQATGTDRLLVGGVGEVLAYTLPQQ